MRCGLSSNLFDHIIITYYYYCTDVVTLIVAEKAQSAAANIHVRHTICRKQYTVAYFYIDSQLN